MRYDHERQEPSAAGHWTSSVRSDLGGDTGNEDRMADQLMTFFLFTQARHERRINQIKAEMAALGADWLPAPV